jgi:hypothetical protein
MVYLMTLSVTQTISGCHHTRGLISCESPRVGLLKSREKGKYNNRHFDIKLAPEFFDAKLIICTTFLDKPGEGLIQVGL